MEEFDLMPLGTVDNIPIRQDAINVQNQGSDHSTASGKGHGAVRVESGELRVLKPQLPIQWVVLLPEAPVQ